MEPVVLVIRERECILGKTIAPNSVQISFLVEEKASGQMDGGTVGWT